MIVENFRAIDAGQYVCMCNTNDGHGFGANFVLNLESPPAHLKFEPTRAKRALLGSNVYLDCDKNQSADAYRWKRVRGVFEIGTNVVRVSLN